MITLEDKPLQVYAVMFVVREIEKKIIFSLTYWLSLKSRFKIGLGHKSRLQPIQPNAAANKREYTKPWKVLYM